MQTLRCAGWLLIFACRPTYNDAFFDPLVLRAVWPAFVPAFSTFPSHIRLGEASPSLPPPSQTVLWEHLRHGALVAPVFGTFPTFSVLCPHLGWVLRLLHSTAADIVELLALEPLLGAFASSLLIAV